jgi:hypothetical protein
MGQPMRKFAFALLVLLLACPGAYGAGSRALLIGISQYTELDSLKYADADVKSMAQLLTGFAGYASADVTLILNQQATKQRITDEIYKVVEASKKEPLDHFILMFAGHGLPPYMNRQETTAFLAPSDAKIAQNAFFSLRKGQELRNESFIDRVWLARQLSEINARQIVILMDSCYSGMLSFGEEFSENLGFNVTSFSHSGSDRGAGTVTRKISSGTATEALLGGRKIAYLASSREDQPSQEYDELRHGALSYSIFESIKRAQREAYQADRRELSVDFLYSDITRLFGEVKVGGVALGEVHQPVLVPIPGRSDMKALRFVAVNGVKRKELETGALEIVTDPPGLEITVDGVRRPEPTNARLQLPEGRHQIELYLPGTGYRHPFTVDISAARPVREVVSLRGVLQVESFAVVGGQRSSGPSLEIFLDGTRVGQAQRRVDSLLAGSHTLEVRLEGVTKTRRVEIRPDSPLHINYSVIREPAPAAPPRDPRRVGNVPI